jgi:hypothetical protein
MPDARKEPRFRDKPGGAGFVGRMPNQLQRDFPLQLGIERTIDAALAPLAELRQNHERPPAPPAGCGAERSGPGLGMRLGRPMY